MARKLGVKSFKCIDAASMGATVTSAISNVEMVDNIGFRVAWTSSDAVGVITVEGSIDYVPVPASGNWEALTFSPALTQPNSDNGSYLININQYPYPWIRVKYTRTSGTGTLNVWLTTKSVGA